MKPHEILDKDLQGRLTDRVLRTINDLKDTDRSGMIYGIVGQAAKYFAHCPDDFCIQHASWYEGHAVFGGTNRLLWSMHHGFRPDPTYCSPKFKAQFEGEVWESIGQLQCDGAEVVLVSSHHLNLDPGEVLPRVRVPLAWAGTQTILGRKSTKGDGKIAEIRFHTGAEA